MLTYILIGINLAVSFWAFSAFKNGNRPERFLFSPYWFARGRSPEGALLSQFSHADMGHLFFNMLTFFFFGPVVERGLGYGMLAVYFLSGLAALLLVFLLRRNDPDHRVLGASGCVTGILFASIVINPSMSIYMFLLPIPIPAPAFAIVYLLFSTWLMKRDGSKVSHEAHVGGAVTGLLLAGTLSPHGFDLLIDRINQLVR